MTVDRGRVQLDGPDSIDVAFTPDAAEEPAKRLSRAAATAREQSSFADDGEDSAPSL